MGHWIVNQTFLFLLNCYIIISTSFLLNYDQTVSRTQLINAARDIVSDRELLCGQHFITGTVKVYSNINIIFMKKHIGNWHALVFSILLTFHINWMKRGAFVTLPVLFMKSFFTLALNTNSRKTIGRRMHITFVSND